MTKTNLNFTSKKSLSLFNETQKYEFFNGYHILHVEPWDKIEGNGNTSEKTFYFSLGNGNGLGQ